MAKVLLRSEASGGEVSIVDTVLLSGFRDAPLHTRPLGDADSGECQ